MRPSRIARMHWCVLVQHSGIPALNDDRHLRVAQLSHVEIAAILSAGPSAEHVNRRLHEVQTFNHPLAGIGMGSRRESSPRLQSVASQFPCRLRPPHAVWRLLRHICGVGACAHGLRLICVNRMSAARTKVLASTVRALGMSHARCAVSGGPFAVGHGRRRYR
jgi:hypothetical protein